MLLDSASLYFRAFYGVPEQGRVPDGTPTNAVRGFLDMIATLITDNSPTHLVACWDNDWRPQWRVDLISSYKAHRVAEPVAAAAGAPDQAHPATGGLAEEVPDALAPQVPIIVDVLAAIGLTRLGVDGYEADDVIGSLAQQWAGRMRIDVVTGDRDLFQLVDDATSTRVLYTARGGVRSPDVITQAVLQDRYAVPTGDAYLDMSVLRGDTSDGLPGVKGIGEKTAAALITAYGSLDRLRTALAAGDPALKGARRANLEAASDYLDVAPRVVSVARDLDLPDASPRLPRRVADPEALAVLAERFRLHGPLTRLLTALGLDTTKGTP